MRSSPFFSLIIPSFNREKFLPITLDSVLEQTFISFEVIVVDDGSTDRTADVVKPYLVDDRVSYHKINNSERGAARNYGVKKSSGIYVTFLDSDDVLLPWHFANAFEIVTKNQYPPAFHLGYEIVHTNGKIDSLPKLPNPVNEKLLEGNFLSCMGVFLARQIALDNPFDEDRRLSGSEDYELWLRIAARIPILTFPQVTSRLINHDDRSVINTDPQKLNARISLLSKKLFSDPPFRERFGGGLAKFDSYRTLYLSLHLALCGERWLAFKNLLVTAYVFPWVIFNYRFIVALKKIVIG